MRDNLKDYVEGSKDDFELYPFDSDGEWKSISNKIGPSKGKNDPWKISGIAACFAAIIGCTIFFMNPETPVNGEIAELERFYDSEINYKITLIKGKLNDDRILNDVAEMDAAFAELKADLNDNVDNEEVITAMMENYQLKLQILEEILSELEKETSEEIL
ncbi:hypothetical protein [Ekhidna sp.]|uniref:hypothetical protein n=1 Tax=Ekhidna sp. TaxID=2608089 RepID=UPI003BA921B1